MTAAPTPWPAPRARGPVDATVELPGSKSMTARALVIAALASGESIVRRPLRSRDTDLMADALRVLGADVQELAAGDWAVVGTAGRPRLSDSAMVDVGLAGTVARFLPAVAALSDGDVTFDGDQRMRERPMAPLIAALRSLGVAVSASGDHLPMTVHGGGQVDGGAVEVDASGSSQLVSGLLLAAPCFTRGLTVRHVGPPVPSRPHLDMTVAMMQAAGAAVTEPTADTWVVAPGGYRAVDTVVEPDLSGASAFLAAAVATGGVIRVPGWPASTTQPGTQLLSLLEQMGATWAVDDAGLELRGGEAVLGVEADLRDCPEMTPAISALAALAKSPSRITGIAHIRAQETDRVHALAVELSRLGAAVEELPDGLVITPRRMRGALLPAYGDHRLAMAWAVLGLAVDGVVVDDIATTAKTMPAFAEMWARMLDAQEVG